MNPAITLFSKFNSVYISDPNGLPVLGQTPFGVYGIQPWMGRAPYQQKAAFSHSLVIQAHTQITTDGTHNDLTPGLYLCDYYDPNGPNGGTFRLVGATANNTLSGSSVDLNTVANGYFKKGGGATPTDGWTFPGNNYDNPFTGTSTPLFTTMWNFSFDDLSISTLGTYYLLFVNRQYSTYPTVVNNYYFSEPIQVASSWPNTMLIQSQLNANRGRGIPTIVSGWSTDNGSTLSPYTPVFLLCVEGYIIDLDPKAVNVGYLQQQWQQVQTYSEQVRMKTIKVGELSIGIPPHLLEQVTEQILSDIFWINNYSYIVFNTSSSAQLSDMWKSRRHDVYPLLWANTVLMERYQAQQAIITPFAPVDDRIFTGEFDDTFA